MTEIEYETDSRDESRVDRHGGVKIDGEKLGNHMTYTVQSEMEKVTDAEVVETQAWDDLQDAVDAGEVEIKTRENERGNLNLVEIKGV